MPSIGSIGTLASGVYVSGLKETRQAFLSLPRRVAVNVVRRGLLAGASVVRDEARRLAPQPPAVSRSGNKRTGLLVRSIRSETRSAIRQGDRNTYIAAVTIRKPRVSTGPNPRRYAHLVEFGVRPHSLGKGSVLAPKKRGTRAVQKGRMHPGFPGVLFMTRAFESKKAQALEVLVQRMRTELAKELEKMRTGARRAG